MDIFERAGTYLRPRLNGQPVAFGSVVRGLASESGSSGKHWRADVRVVGELPVRRREQASRP